MPCRSIAQRFLLAQNTRLLHTQTLVSETQYTMDNTALDEHAEKAWSFFRSIGSPKLHVAPMVDQSELPFRMLCRRHGATCAYTPMLHARLFVEDKKYRREHWTTCEGDRPLLVQFCANDPSHLLAAASIVAPHADAVDLNLGCPQRIAKRGRYGAFLMDDLALVERLVSNLAQNLPVPVTCKIRIFPELSRTLAYARMLEAAGCSMLAVHGRTRDMKDAAAHRADWAVIREVKRTLRIPVLANGDVRCGADVLRLMEETGADGVLSAEPLLEDPALFSPRRLMPQGAYSLVEAISLLQEYLELAEQYPVPIRMVKGHMHRLVGSWLAEHVDLRDVINRDPSFDLAAARDLAQELARRVAACGRDHPVPALSARKMAQMAAEAARAAAIEEQDREQAALAALGLDMGQDQGPGLGPGSGPAPGQTTPQSRAQVQAA